MRFLTRRVLLIALLISFVPCLFLAFPVLVFVTHDDPGLSVVTVLMMGAIMFIMGLGVQYIDFLRDNRNR